MAEETSQPATETPQPTGETSHVKEVEKSIKTPKGGCLRMFVIFLILTMAAMFGGLYGIKYYSVNCQGMLVSDCVLKMADKEEAEVSDSTVVKASGPYTYNGHTVTMTANIPLNGGAVTGAVEGECHGKVTGTYDGKDTGNISGNMSGYCDLAVIPIPAKATYSGIVDKQTKSVLISFNGSATGFTHSGSLTLSY